MVLKLNFVHVRRLGSEVKGSVCLLVVHLKEVDPQVLDVLACHAVLPIEELDDLLSGGAHCAVVLDHYVLHGFDQAALDVACLSGLDSSINESLSTSHSVEEELLRGEPIQVAVLYEALALRAIVILGEVRESSLVEAEGDSLALDVLLAYASHNLRYVQIGALRASVHHGFESVPGLQVSKRHVTRDVSGRIESLVD